MRYLLDTSALLAHYRREAGWEQAGSADEMHRVLSRRQVFDRPEPKLEVTEHRLGEVTKCSTALVPGAPFTKHQAATRLSATYGQPK